MVADDRFGGARDAATGHRSASSCGTSRSCIPGAFSPARSRADEGQSAEHPSSTDPLLPHGHRERQICAVFGSTRTFASRAPARFCCEPPARCR